MCSRRFVTDLLLLMGGTYAIGHYMLSYIRSKVGFTKSVLCIPV